MHYDTMTNSSQIWRHLMQKRGPKLHNGSSGLQTYYL